MVMDYQKLKMALLVSVIPFHGACSNSPDPTPTPTLVPGTPTPNAQALCNGGESQSIVGADGQDSGYAQCDNGNVHKTGPAQCNPEHLLPACQGTETFQECQSDADCTDGPNGYCASDMQDFGGGYYEQSFCGCRYTCATDSDCGDGYVCACGEVAGDGSGESYCIPAECDVDLSCDSGECGLSSFNDGCDLAENMTCRSEADECTSDSECVGEEVCTASGYESEGYQCEEPSCVLGRALHIDGSGRTTTSIKRVDWMGAMIEVDLSSLSPADKRRLRDHWLRAAQVEHSSVASFNRASLQLMALGAPADILRDTQEAAIDEIEHTQISYAMASLYGDENFGPGPMPLGDLNLDLDWASVMVGLIEEACVGEAIGVAEATAAANQVKSPSFKKALLQIAADEERHVQLAWRTLRWILECRPDLLGMAQSTLEEAAARILARTADAQDDDNRLIGHGLLGKRSRHEVRENTVTFVVLPVFYALTQSLRAAA